MITEWLDNIFRGYETTTGLRAEELSAAFGGELVGTIFEMIADYFTKGWLNKLIQLGTGLLAIGYALGATGASPRTRRELIELGTHELMRIIKLSPEEIKELRDSIRFSLEALSAGDWGRFFSEILKSPTEILTELGLYTPAAPTPIPLMAPAPETSAPAPETEFELR
jgi:hypothetical protein